MQKTTQLLRTIIARALPIAQIMNGEAMAYPLTNAAAAHTFSAAKNISAP
jgi:hypothetical protein